MERVIECPFCESPRFIKMSVKSGVKYPNIIYEECINIKCKKKFIIPVNYKTIYLARTFVTSDAKYKYAIHVKNHFSGVLYFIDPYDFESNDRLFNHPETIVPFNLKLIDKCDIFVAFINQPSFGTLGELHYARHKGIPVYVINHNRIHTNNPWLKYVVNGLYTDVDKCYHDLINMAVKEYNFGCEKEN